jgi:hypothetical protein
VSDNYCSSLWCGRVAYWREDTGDESIVFCGCSLKYTVAHHWVIAFWVLKSYSSYAESNVSEESADGIAYRWTPNTVSKPRKPFADEHPQWKAENL